MERTNVPLFISINRLLNRKKKFNQNSSIAIDSGGFTELSKNGKWTRTPEEYVKELHNCQKLGLKIDWAAPQDWMTENFILEKTGLTIEDHQKKTVENLINLRKLTSKIHFIPVLQGQTIQDYLNHIEMYYEKGIKLKEEELVGIGSVCRRQHTDEIFEIIQTLHSQKLNLHGFGIKKKGLIKYGHLLNSADSMAWSYNGRFQKCPFGKNGCQNCLHHALKWRNELNEQTTPE
jgi:hypothetical protein